MSANLRIPQEMLKGWVDALLPRADLRGAPAVAKEMEALLRKVEPDGHVIVGRHQLFTWSQTLQGIARRAPLGSPVQAIVEEVHAVLAGRDASATSSAASRPPPPPPASSSSLFSRPSMPPPPTYEYTPPPPSPSRSAAPSSSPPVSYLRGPAPGAAAASAAAPTAASAAGDVRLVPETEVHAVVGDLLRGARRELLIVSPWTLGLETLVQELVRTPSSVALRIVSRRAEREDEAYHRALRDLQRRGAELVMSPFLHTRMVVADGEALLLGAAGLPKPGVHVAREAALLTRDAQAVAGARAHFHRIQEEARNGPPR